MSLKRRSIEKDPFFVNPRTARSSPSNATGIPTNSTIYECTSVLRSKILELLRLENIPKNGSNDDVYYDEFEEVSQETFDSLFFETSAALVLSVFLIDCIIVLHGMTWINQYQY